MKLKEGMILEDGPNFILLMEKIEKLDHFPNKSWWEVAIESDSNETLEILLFDETVDYKIISWLDDELT